MAQANQYQRRGLLRTALLLLAAWLITLTGLFLLYAEYRESTSLFLWGTRYRGSAALSIMAVYAVIPITLLAVALKKLFEYNRFKR
ncbi:MAG: hypothetical protein OET44_06080 [Gammaproteobacteria bacterium]|nr:hypothetical protein [Gammaproteobacteria bacterium]